MELVTRKQAEKLGCLALLELAPKDSDAASVIWNAREVFSGKSKSD